MNKPKPEVGQTLYSLNVGNSARYAPQTLTPVVVSKVGRKYFTVDKGWRGTEYHLDTWAERTDYSPNSKLYSSPADWETEKEISEICKLLEDYFRYGRNQKNINIGQLRRIKAILTETE